MADLSSFSFLNLCPLECQGERASLLIPPRCGFYCAPAGERKLDAPFCFQETVGDFTARVQVGHAFTAQHDAGGLLAFYDENCWAKLAFARSEAGEPAVVSVVTQGASDAASGPVLTGGRAWLQLSRKGSLFAMHVSPDGQAWRLARAFSLCAGEKLKVGVFGQSPLGQGGRMDFYGFSLEPAAPADLRRGV